MQIYWIWLAQRRDMRASEKLRVVDRFPKAEDIYFAGRSALEKIEGLSREAVEALLDKDLSGAEKILTGCRNAQMRVLTWQDEQYPARLRQIADPPLVLYYKGTLPDFESVPVIGVVGTRKASAYGLKTASRMGFQIARCGGLVVSGMAGGIDARATEGALAAGKGAVGVLGCGADRIFPMENRELYARMAEEGCLLSEFPPGTPPYKWNFPKRNRIISGLSCAVLVVEAPERSGALITARQALEQGREVFVVPGNVDVPTSVGSNALLRDGAGMAATGWDVVSEFQHSFPDAVFHDTAQEPWLPKEPRLLQVAQPVEKMGKGTATDKKGIDYPANSMYSDVDCKPRALTADEQTVLGSLPEGEVNIDDVIAGTGMRAGAVLAVLTVLQMEGYVKLLPGGRARRENR